MPADVETDYDAAVNELRLLLKASKGVLRDLSIAVARVERLSNQPTAEPKEAEHGYEISQRCVA